MNGLDVAIVVPSLVRGGAERVAINLANGLGALGDRVRLIVTGSEMPLAGAVSKDVRLVMLGRTRVRRALGGVVAELRRDPPDVVLGTHTHVNLALCGISPLLPSRTRLALREPIYAPVELAGRSTRGTRLAQRLLYRRAAVVLASSDVLAEDLASITRAPIERVENPVDVAGIRARARGGPTPRAGRRFVSVGRLHPQKAMDDLIVAFAEIAHPLDVLAIIGDGSERETLERLVARLGFDGRVLLLGHRDDHWSEVASADAFVLASRNEGMPNAVLEALALGTPVLTTDDLVMLHDLATDIGPEGLRLVPREALPAAMAAIERRAGGVLAPSLLPERFHAERAVVTLRIVLEALLDQR